MTTGVFDDLIPGSPAPPDAASPGLTTGVFDDLIPQSPSASGAFGRGAIRGAGGAFGGMAGMGLGAAAGTAVGGPIGGVIGAVLGAGAGGYSGGVAEEAGLKYIPGAEKALHQTPQEIAADQAAHPIAAKLGEFAPAVATMRPGLGMLREGAGLLENTGRVAGASAGGAALNTGIQAGTNLITGQPITEGLPESAAAGALLTTPTALGRGLERLGAGAAYRFGVPRPAVPEVPQQPITDETRLLPPPAIAMPDGSVPPSPGQPLALPPPSPENRPSPAWVAGQEANSGGTLGPQAPGQFVMPDYTPPDVAFGDSLAVGAQRHAGVSGTEAPFKGGADQPGTARVGAPPNEVLQRILSAPQGQISGKDVLLSTGVSNNPSDIDAVKQQIAALYSRGATNVRVMGVGTRSDLAPLNGQLSDIAAANNATFLGPLKNVGKDQVHSTDYAAEIRGQTLDQRVPTSAGAPDNRFQQAVDFFVDKGMTRDQAIGVTARLHAESGLDPNITNGIGATGIAQWYDRRPAMEAAGAKGDFQKQLDYIWHEFNTSEGKAFDAIRGAGNAADAARAMELFERAGNPHFTESAAQLANSIADGGPMPAAGRGGGRSRGVGEPGGVGALAGGAPAASVPSVDLLSMATKEAGGTSKSPELDKAAAADTPLSRAITALADMQPGEYLTTRRLGEVAGVNSRNQINNLRDSLVQRGLVTSEDGRYKRADTINTAQALAPTPAQTASLPQSVQAPRVEPPPVVEPTAHPPIPEPAVITPETAHPAEPPPAQGIIKPEPTVAAEAAPKPPIAQQYQSWLDSGAVTAGSKANNAALRNKLYELSPELQQARAETQAANRAVSDADQMHLGGPLAPPELREAASVAEQNERALYNGLRRQVAGMRASSGLRYQRPDGLPIEPNPEHQALRDELYSIVKETAPSLRLKTFNDLFENGRQKPVYGKFETENAPGNVLEHIATIALGGPDPVGALHHEIMHFMRASGLFKKPEWEALATKADKWRDQFKIDERYGDQPLGIRREEAIAEAYTAWHHGELQAPPGVRRVFQRIADVFERVGNFLKGRGYQNADDVFQRMRSGEVGAREPLTSGSTPEALYQRPHDIASDEERAAYERLVSQGDQRTIHQRGQDLWSRLRQDMGARFKQSFVDATTGREVLEKELNAGRLMDPKVSPTEEARRAGYLNSMVSVALGVDGPGGKIVGGPLRFSTAKGTFEPIPGAEPLHAIAKPIWEKGLQTKAALYMIARRAEDLMAQGRENLVKRADLKYLDLAKQHPEIAEFAKKWDEFNKHLLDFSEWGGTLSKETRTKFGRNYVPFFRIDENGDAVQAGTKGLGQHMRGGFKKLTGGEEQINDLWDNMFHNVEMIMGRAVRNHANKSMVELASGGGGVTPLSKTARDDLRTPQRQAELAALGVDPVDAIKRADELGKGLYGMQQKNDPKLVSFMADGVPQYYYIENPLLMRSITAFGPQAVNPVLKILGMPAHILSRAVTAMPDYMMRNLLRDTLQTQALTPEIKIPGAGTFKGFVDAYRNSPAMLDLMAGGGGGGTGQWYKQDVSPLRQKLEREMPQSLRDRVLDTPRKLLAAYEEIGKASEQANRLAILNAKKGENFAGAIKEARDIMPFAQRGDSEIMKALITLVPFMNARVQGLNRMYRGFKENPASLLIRGGLLTAATAALWLNNKDDPRYQQLPDYARQNYFHLMGPGFHFMLPQPFEHGAIFSNIPEIMLNYMNNGSSKEAANAAWAVLKNQLNFDPTPQVIKPALDVYTNTDSFTGAPIVSQGEQQLEPGIQVSPQTSRIIAALGGQLDLSPDKLDHLVKGYTGSLGMYVLAAADGLGAQAGALPQQPSGRMDRIPVISSFYRQDPEGASRDLTDFYELSNSVQKLHASINLLRTQGRGAEAAALAMRDPTDTGLYTAVQGLSHQLGNIRKQERAINAAVAGGSMTPDQGREHLDQITAMKSMLGAQSARQLNRIHEGRPTI